MYVCIYVVCIKYCVVWWLRCIDFVKNFLYVMAVTCIFIYFSCFTGLRVAMDFTRYISIREFILRYHCVGFFYKLPGRL